MLLYGPVRVINVVHRQARCTRATLFLRELDSLPSRDRPGECRGGSKSPHEVRDVLSNCQGGAAWGMGMEEGGSHREELKDTVKSLVSKHKSSPHEQPTNSTTFVRLHVPSNSRYIPHRRALRCTSWPLALPTQDSALHLGQHQAYGFVRHHSLGVVCPMPPLGPHQERT